MSDGFEQQTFRHETVRTIAFSAIGLVVTWYVLGRLDTQGQRAAHLDKERLRIKQEVIDDFLNASYSYSSESYDVMDDSQRSGEAIPDDRSKWNCKLDAWDTVHYQLYRRQLNRLKTYFKDEIKKHSDIDECLKDAGTVGSYFKKYLERDGSNRKKVLAVIHKRKEQDGVQQDDPKRNRAWENARLTFKHCNNLACSRLLQEIELLNKEKNFWLWLVWEIIYWLPLGLGLVIGTTFLRCVYVAATKRQTTRGAAATDDP